MTKKNASYVIVIVILIISLLVVIVAFFRDIRSRYNTQKAARIYFKTTHNSLEYEEHPVFKQDEAKMADDVLKMFKNGPKNQNLLSIMPADLRIIEPPKILFVPERSDYIFAVNFSKEYFNMTPIEEVLFRAALVWTMTDLDFINNVEIRVEDEEIINSLGMPMNMQNQININIQPVIKPYNPESRDVVLYFADETGTKLLYEKRQIVVDPDLPIEKFIVDHIIQGPRQKGHFPTVSPDVKIRLVENQEGTCFVNLSMDFVNKKPVEDEVAVYSIVNSLMEEKRVKKVQFLIESEKETQYLGNIDLSRPFERNDDIIINEET